MNIGIDILSKLKSELDTQASTPLYMQLDQILRNAIEEGLLMRGAALPPERNIAENLGISRVTVRKTIERLEKAGFCSRKRGAGTFVSGPASVENDEILPQSLSALHGFSEDMRSRGLEPSSITLDSRLAVPTAEEIFSLNLNRERVLRLTRIRFADGKPMAIEVSSFPATILPSEEDIGESVYAAMGKAGHEPVRAIQRITACALDAEQAKHLDVAEKDPALFISRVAYDIKDRPVEYTKSHYRADCFDFVAELVTNRH
jgi:GntR family transcriptional regulator, N-acetylglucosamine utilization regulator